MKFHIFITLIFLSGTTLLSAQNRISGRVTDAKTNKAIPFVNIGAEGTSIGTTSDVNGQFSIEIPADRTIEELSFSSLGFDTEKRKISKLLNSNEINVRLNPQDYDIEEVVVEDKSYFPYLILRRANDNITRNYPQTAHNYRFLYENKIVFKNKKDRERKAILMMYDSKGYKRQGFYDSYVNRNYEFRESRRNFEVRSPDAGNTFADDLLSMDIVHTAGNILDKQHSRDFDVSIARETVLGSDSVWVLQYRCTKPLLKNTGFYYAQTYEGEITISKQNYAILKNKTSGKLNHLSKLGRDQYIAPSETHRHWPEGEYRFVTEYRKTEDKYLLSTISFSYNIFQDNRAEAKTIESMLKVLDYNEENPEKIQDRDYFENQPYKAEFWTAFKQNTEQ